MMLHDHYTHEAACQLFATILQRYTQAPVPAAVPELLMKYSRTERYARNTLYCREGEHTDKTGLLLFGSAKAYNMNAEGQETIIKFFLPEDFVSPDNPQTGVPSDRTICFTADSQVLTLSNLAHTIGLVQQGIFPELAETTMGMYQQEIELSRKISRMRAPSDAKSKIRIYYQHFAHLDQQFNTTDIASFIGLSRETFSRYRNEVLREL